MLHTKIQTNRPSGEDFERFLLFIAMEAILIMSCDLDHLYKLSFPCMKFGFDWPSGFRGDDL